MTNEELIRKIKNYIKKEINQSFDFYEGVFLIGKIAACNNIYDYIEKVLEQEINNEKF